jgi:hypothetical protein
MSTSSTVFEDLCNLFEVDSDADETTDESFVDSNSRPVTPNLFTMSDEIKQLVKQKDHLKTKYYALQLVVVNWVKEDVTAGDRKVIQDEMLRYNLRLEKLEEEILDACEDEASFRPYKKELVTM